MRFVYKLCVYMVQVCITKRLLLVGWKSIKEVYNSPNSQKIMTQRRNKTHSVPFLYNCTLCCWCFSKIVSFLPLASSFISILFLQMLLHLNDAWILPKVFKTVAIFTSAFSIASFEKSTMLQTALHFIQMIANVSQSCTVVKCYILPFCYDYLIWHSHIHEFRTKLKSRIW